MVSLRSGSNARDGDEGVAGRNVREKRFPDEGSLICPPGKSMIFYNKETEKNCVIGQTCNVVRRCDVSVDEKHSFSRCPSHCFQLRGCDFATGHDHVGFVAGLSYSPIN